VREKDYRNSFAKQKSEQFFEKFEIVNKVPSPSLRPDRFKGDCMILRIKVRKGNDFRQAVQIEPVLSGLAEAGC